MIMAVGTAIGLGAAGLIGSIVNAVSQDKTNKQMMSYQTSEREAAQEYNSPENQRKRFEAAGINPYFALGNITSGETTAQTSPALQAPQYGDMLKGLAEGVSQGYDVYQKEQMVQQTQLGIEQMRVDTRYKLTEKLLELSEQRAKIANMNMDTAEKRKQLSFLDKQMESLQLDIDATKADFDEQRAITIARRKQAETEAETENLRKEYQSWFNDFQQKYGDQQLNQIKSIIASNLSAAALNKSLSAKAAADKVVSEAQAKGIKIDNFQKNKINWMIREGVRLDNKMKRWDATHPSAVDKLFGNAQSLDRMTGLETNKPSWTPVWQNGVTSRW